MAASRKFSSIGAGWIGDFMPTRTAEAEWKGNLAEGGGRLKVGSGAFEGPYTFKSRFEDGESATNPEELLSAAHAGCFTMVLAAKLARERLVPTRIHTEAKVKLEKVGDAFSITRIDLATEAKCRALTTIGFRSTRATRNKTVHCRRSSRQRKSI
jgi:lipoyl-dependent peroxiredoxin